MKTLRTGAAILALGIFLPTATTIAQTDSVGGPRTTAIEDDRPNYTPLLGLLGLLGLMGLKRRHDQRDHTERR